MTVHRFSMTNILGIKREQQFAAMTREESDASLARAGAQGGYLPAHRHACYQAVARKGGKSLIDRAEVTATRAKIRLLQHARPAPSCLGAHTDASPRLLVPATRGAMIAFRTLGELQTGQLTSPRLT